jgi:hypothetical protein
VDECNHCKGYVDQTVQVWATKYKSFDFVESVVVFGAHYCGLYMLCYTLLMAFLLLS